LFLYKILILKLMLSDEEIWLSSAIYYHYTNFASMNDEYFMKQALQLAQRAYEEDEVPVGAVIVMNEKIIAKGYNQVEKLVDCTAHAEIIALTSAFNFLGSKYLMEASIYITVEPCVMCAGALYWSKIGKVIYGAADEKNGYQRITRDVSPFHPKTVAQAGILQKECGELLKEFFAQKRK
jgi:tRNA(adenine34) deaminase